MKAVILAAGRGTRMGKLTKNTPKPLLKINKKPKLAYTVEQLPSEITEVVFIIGYLGEQIKNYFGNEYAHKNIHYIEQTKLNGTGGAVMLAKSIVGDSKFLVLMGDDLYLKSDLEKMLKYNFAALAYKSKNSSNYAISKTDSDGFLTEVIEVPHNEKSGYANTGAYMLSSEFFDWKLIPKQEGSDEYGLPQTLVKNKGDNKIKVIPTEKWFPIGDPQALEKSQNIIHEFTETNK